MGELHLDININGITIQDIMPAIIGDQGTLWNNRVVDLTPYKGNVKLIFRGVVGAGFRSDIALDDVSLRDAMPVGLESNSDESVDLLIYPNPAMDQVSITHSGKQQQDLQIFNAVGSLVWEGVIDAQSSESFDISRWSKGIYQIHLINGDQRKVEKLIVQ